MRGDSSDCWCAVNHRVSLHFSIRNLIKTQVPVEITFVQKVTTPALFLSFPGLLCFCVLNVCVCVCVVRCPVSGGWYVQH
jgi:hypothetical protein